MSPKNYIFTFGLFLFVNVLVAQTFQWVDKKPVPKSPYAKQSQQQRSASNQQVEVGEALYYADYFEGNTTAMGEIYRGAELSAAHRTHPLGTLLKITRIDNNMSVTVRVNDRGPFVDGAIVDISSAAAQQIDLIKAGRTRVKVEVVGTADKNPLPSRNRNSNLTARGGNNYQTQQPPSYSYTNDNVYYQRSTQESNQRTPAPQEQWMSKGKSTDEGFSDDRLSASNNNYQEDYAVRPPSYNIPIPQETQQRQTQARTPTQQTYSPPPPPARNNVNEVGVITNDVQGYAIQVGSYGNFNNAQRHVQSLQAKGSSNVYVKQGQSRDGSTVNRVIIGPYPSRNDAVNALDNMSIRGLVIKL